MWSVAIAATVLAKSANDDAVRGQIKLPGGIRFFAMRTIMRNLSAGMIAGFPAKFHQLAPPPRPLSGEDVFLFKIFQQCVNPPRRIYHDAPPLRNSVLKK
jgi:hypothetical protein